MKKRLFLTLLISALALGTYAQPPANYISNDWAFFELKGKVKAVKITKDDRYTEEHTFSRSGVLLGEDATGDDMWSDNPFGYTRDANGRINGTGNGHNIWTWKGRTVVKHEYGHMGDELTFYYLYDQSGKRTGYKDEKGKVHKYTYMDYEPEVIGHTAWVIITILKGERFIITNQVLSIRDTKTLCSRYRKKQTG